MKKVSLLLIITSLFISCADETTVFKEFEDDISLEKNQQILINSIVYDNSGVIDIIDKETINAKRTGLYAKPPGDELAGGYPLTLVAQVTPPSFGGNGGNLTATDVFLDGDYAYVSYNTVDEIYFGGVDVIDISDPTAPFVSSRLYYSNVDANAIAYDNGFLYFVGGVDAEQSARATANSFLVKVSCVNGVISTAGGFQTGFQEGFNANDVVVTSNSVLVSSGRDGFLTVYDKNTLTIQNDAAFADLRALSLNNTDIAVLDASTGVTIMDAGLQITSQINISSDFGSASKRTIDYEQDKIYVSEGSSGAGVYDATNGMFLEHVPILINPDGVAASDIVTNAVSLNQDVLFMANGGAGLSLAEENNGSYDLVGVINLSGSINHVESEGDYLFAASGREGLQIIKLNRPSESLAARCSGLPAYSGSARLDVNVGESFEYSTSNSFRRIRVYGELLLCGTLTVRNAVNVYDDGLFEMNGSMTVGSNSRTRNVNVNDGSILRIEGNLTIYGNLNLNDGATLEFIGPDSVVTVYGNVNQAATSEVIGIFDDTENKF